MHLDQHRPVRRDRDAPGLGGGVVHGPRVAAVDTDGLDPVRGAAADDAVACAHSFASGQRTDSPWKQQVLLSGHVFTTP